MLSKFALAALVVLVLSPSLPAQNTSDTLTTSPVVHSDCKIFPNRLPDNFAGERHFTIIDIASQHLACYENGKLVRICNVCTARWIDDKYLDQTGPWRVIKKSQKAVSSIWKDKSQKPFSMPWAVATGGGFWIHQGELPGKPSSHGCIRMSSANARWYFGWSKLGDKGFAYRDFAKLVVEDDEHLVFIKNQLEKQSKK